MDRREQYKNLWRNKTIVRIEKEIESWRRHFQKHDAGYGFTSGSVAAPDELADGDRFNILRELLQEKQQLEVRDA